MNGWWLAIGIVVGGPIWGGLTAWYLRRVWRSSRRLAARTRGRRQLVELGQLAGGLAHEIRNPLSTVNLNLKLLIEDVSQHDDELHRRWLHRLTSVQEEANRLRDILDDFLRFAGKYELSLRRSDLRKIVEELTDFFGPQADAAHVLMRTALPEQPLPCHVDGKLIKQAMLNLMINGVQAMDEGGELLVRHSAQRDQAVIEVIDTGPGIAPEDLSRIFEVYYSTKKSGSGLGLPTTRRIVQEHRGTIRADSEIGKGTRFIIALPLAEE